MGQIDFAAHRSHLTVGAVGQQVDLLADAGTTYERIPSVAEAQADRPWIKLDLNGVGDPAGISGLGDLAQDQLSQPALGLQALRGVSGAVTTVGQEVIGTVHSTHRRADVDLPRAADRTPASERATLRRIIDRFRVRTAVVDAWTDGEGRALRVHLHLDFGAAPPNVLPGGPPASVETEVEFSDFGTAVSIHPPAPGQVADLGQLDQGGPASADASRLASLIVAALPAGYRQADDASGDGGPADLGRAARADGNLDAQRALTFDGFLAGYQRSWGRGTSAISVSLLQFRTTAGATAYEERLAPLALGGTGPGGRQVVNFPVPSVPAAKGVLRKDARGAEAEVIFSKGGYVVQLFSNGPDATPALAASLAKQQFLRL